MSELKPCPFCGGAAVYSKHFSRVRCINCFVRTEPGDEKKCTTEWNRRTESNARDEALEEAAKACEELEMPIDSVADDLAHECATLDCARGIRALKSAPEADMVSVPASVAKFAAWIIRELRDELGDIDGGTAQDKMLDLGMLKNEQVTEPCGESCRCVEYGEFPHDCLRLEDDVQTMLAARSEK